MPTILSHPAVPLALGMALGPEIVPKPLLMAGIVASILPDIDFVSFSFGVRAGTPFAHRGLTHSLAFAALVALFGAIALHGAAGGFWKPLIFLFLSAASHGILDAFTNGGPGSALFWPWSPERFFAPFRPILVSPISVTRLLSQRGIQVLTSELIWVWMPCVLLWYALVFVRADQTLLGATSLKRIFRPPR